MLNKILITFMFIFSLACAGGGDVTAAEKKSEARVMAEYFRSVKKIDDKQFYALLPKYKKANQILLKTGDDYLLRSVLINFIHVMAVEQIPDHLYALMPYYHKNKKKFEKAAKAVMTKVQQKRFFLILGTTSDVSKNGEG